jgi:hypothetical protein
MFLGLTGVPTSRLTYEAFKLASTATNAVGALFRGASAAAVAGIVARGSLVTGAGLAGFWIGQKILEDLEYDGPEPEIAETYRTPGNAGRIRLTASINFNPVGEQVFVNDFDSPVIAPFVQTVGASLRFGVIAGNPPAFNLYVQTTPEQIVQPLKVISATKINGDPVPELKKVPGYAPTFAPAPFKLPTTIPISPAIPDFPITPTVVPNPDNDPEEGDDKAKEPGVVVQIPEMGTQIVFTPTGVTIGRYRSPETEPTEAPKVPPPPGTPPVSEGECPCPEPENNNEEIICRLKALQEEILDDGFTQEITLHGGGQSHSVSGLGESFFRVETNAISFPSNAKRISYPAPGIDTVFVGNMQFLVAGAPTEPIPIRGISQVMFPPEGATGYVVSGASGFSITSAAYVRTKRPYVDNC